MRAKALTRHPLVRVAGGQAHLVAQRTNGSDGKEAKRPTTNDDHPLARQHRGSAGAMPGHPGRLDETGVFSTEPGRKWHEIGLRHNYAVTQTSVCEDPEVGVRPDAALGVSRLTFGTGPTRDRRVDCVRHTVDRAGELMADGESTETTGQKTDVSAADARRPDFEHHTWAGRLINVDDFDAALGVANRSHLGDRLPATEP
jgi:hypothetical protein